MNEGNKARNYYLFNVALDTLNALYPTQKCTFNNRGGCKHELNLSVLVPFGHQVSLLSTNTGNYKINL